MKAVPPLAVFWWAVSRGEEQERSIKPAHAALLTTLVGVDALDMGVGVLANETGVRAFLPLPVNDWEWCQ